MEVLSVFARLSRLALCVGGALTVFASLAQAQEQMSIAIAFSASVQRYAHQCRRDPAEAEAMAMRRCALFGVNDCQLVGTASDGLCVALAVGPAGEIGIGDGSNQTEAASRAAVECGAGCVTRVARCSRRTCEEN